jgi:hypothetical protein
LSLMMVVPGTASAEFCIMAASSPRLLALTG